VLFRSSIFAQLGYSCSWFFYSVKAVAEHIICLLFDCNAMILLVLQLQTFIEESVEFITLKIQPTLACSQPHPPLSRDKPIPTGKVRPIRLKIQNIENLNTFTQ